MTSRRWLVLALVFFGILVSYVDRGNLGVAANSMMKDLQMPSAITGRLLSAFFWTYAICQIPAGYIVDKLGVRGAYAGAFLLWSLASAGVALSTNSTDIFSLRLLLGLAESVGPVASLAVIRASFPPRENGVPTAVYIAGQTLGPAVGLALGGPVLVFYGWRTLFAITGLAGLIWVPIWLAFSPRVAAREKGSPMAWNLILKNFTLWAMAIAVLMFSYYWYFVLSWVPTYLISARGFSTLAMTGILSAPLATMAVTNLASGWCADRLLVKSVSIFRVRLWFAAGGLIGSSSLLLLNFSSSQRVVMPILFLSVCSFGVVSSSFWTIAQNVAPPDKVGRVIGFLNTISQIGGILAPLITGYLLGPKKDFTAALAIAALLPLVALIPMAITGWGIDKLRSTLDYQQA